MATRDTIWQAKYDKANTRQFHLKFNLKTDADIIARLDQVDSMQGYIKALIRADLEREGKKNEE